MSKAHPNDVCVPSTDKLTFASLQYSRMTLLSLQRSQCYCKCKEHGSYHFRPASFIIDNRDGIWFQQQWSCEVEAYSEEKFQSPFIV